jgi:cytochrome oxidase Cu insertion factor (SCO1/SenC/PrrC family)
MKKGQGLPVNVIIIAAIALLVLVVLSVIFVGNVAPINPAVKNCEEAGGLCRSVASGCFEGESQTSARQCLEGRTVDQTRVCCLPVA